MRLRKNLKSLKYAIDLYLALYSHWIEQIFLLHALLISLFVWIIQCCIFDPLRIGALGIKPMAKNILEPHSFVVITHSPKIYFKLYNIIHNVFRPEDAQTLLTIAGDFEFDSLEMSDTKKFFVLFQEYLHAVIENQQT